MLFKHDFRRVKLLVINLGGVVRRGLMYLLLVTHPTGTALLAHRVLLCIPLIAREGVNTHFR